MRTLIWLQQISKADHADLIQTLQNKNLEPNKVSTHHIRSQPLSLHQARLSHQCLTIASNLELLPPIRARNLLQSLDPKDQLPLRQPALSLQQLTQSDQSDQVASQNLVQKWSQGNLKKVQLDSYLSAIIAWMVFSHGVLGFWGFGVLGFRV